jgi:TolB-like protein
MTAPSEVPPLGPVEYIVVHFAGSRFTGEIAPALTELIGQGLVRINDLAVVGKDSDGTVSILEIQELSPEVAAAFVKLEGSVSGLLSEADLEAVAEALAPGDTAAALLFEHVWATRFAEAVRVANGTLVLAERIPHAVMAEARASLLAAAQ